MASADVVLFAIQGALRMGAQARAAYVDSTRSRQLVLPLPKFKPSASFSAAANHFLQRDVSQESPQLQELVGKLKQGVPLASEEQQLLMRYHEDEVLKSFGATESTPAADGSPVTGRALAALVTIRQWQRGSDPHPSALQRLAGTFLEIGVDYFTDQPGGLAPNSRTGRGLRAFFTGFDGLRFSTDLLGDLPARMFSAAMESVAKNPDLITQDPKVQELVTAATRGLAGDVARRIAHLQETRGSDPAGDERTRVWGELVFRSLLASVGKQLAEAPDRFLGVTREANAAMVAGVASAAIAVVLDQPEGELEEAFSQPGLERVAEAALGVVVRHPELVTGDRNRLQPLVSQIARDLVARDRPFGNQAVPEIARIVLDRTAENLPLLWPGAADDPKQHLGLAAARTTLEILARQPQEGEPWQPAFTPQDLSAVVNAALGELVDHPGWLISQTGELSGALAAALEAMIGVLRRRADARVGTGVAVDLIRAGLETAASRREFLEVLPNGTPIVGALLDAVLSQALEADAEGRVPWRWVKREVLVGLFETAAQQVAKTRLDPGKVAVVEHVLAQGADAIRAGEPWDLQRFAADLEGALSAG